ncbi:hypothetical protein BDEG_21404 [Batrachochytrium dendrobatidis JEL423]|uniref:Uncharacterized protein n=1 Tax=Batrachochytrium dendrobatidis (strain JEL423) TaxID=403673 RepID=A0A177WBG7_BATDL|nr:hypothetical protein BDEG_21404 [Batrachochytrium dendrobatidis JEL423]
MSTIVHSKMQVVITWYAKNIITAVLNDTIGITSHRIVEWNGVMVVVCVAPPGMSRAAANVISKRSSILSGQCYHVKSSIWLNDTVDVYVPEQYVHVRAVDSHSLLHWQHPITECIARSGGTHSEDVVGCLR